MAAFAKSALGSLSKGQQTSNVNTFAELIKAKLAERQAEHAAAPPADLPKPHL